MLLLLLALPNTRSKMWLSTQPWLVQWQLQAAAAASWLSAAAWSTCGPPAAVVAQQNALSIVTVTNTLASRECTCSTV